MAKNIIELDRVSKFYQEGGQVLKACDEISLSIKKGELVSITGPSGSGKSTLMNIIGLLDIPSEGEVIIEGEKIGRKTKGQRLAYLRREKIGFIFQTFNLLPKLTAVQNVELPMIYAHKKQRRQRALELLRMVGLEERVNHRPNELSGGERQRVAIARALANEPTLILADEPTGNLDSKSGEKVMQILKELNRKGTTLVIVTHDPNISRQAEREIKIKDGRLDK